MSKAQWGHGYYKGIEEAQKASGTLVGLWFHSFNEIGELDWQGKIVRDTEDGYLVQLFSFVDGSPVHQELVDREVTKKWRFYESDFDMRTAYYRHHGWGEEDIDFAEKCVELNKKLWAS